MNIYTVRDNLKTTIEGKEQLFEEMKTAPAASQSQRVAMMQMLEININELRKILADVEKCCTKATADSWAQNPDRSGGAFTDEEIRQSEEWR